MNVGGMSVFNVRKSVAELNVGKANFFAFSQREKALERQIYYLTGN